jgi:hypothetical protein
MPKVKVSQKTKLQLHQREFEGEMITKLFIAERVKKQLFLENAFKCFRI